MDIRTRNKLRDKDRQIDELEDRLRDMETVQGVQKEVLLEREAQLAASRANVDSLRAVVERHERSAMFDRANAVKVARQNQLLNIIGECISIANLGDANE